MHRTLTRTALLASLALSSACGNSSPRPRASASPQAPVEPAAPGPTVAPTPPSPPPPPPATVERLRVPGDQAASIVRGLRGAPHTIFLPGLCSNANAYLRSFPEAARVQGGVVAIEGDQPCNGAPGFHSFSWDAARQHARIEAALAAAGLTEIPREGITIVGYSQGASIAEQLVQRWPSRYTRVVLIGPPTDPAPQHLVTARAVVTMSCSRDIPWRMKESARRIADAGVPATYFEMPDCTHGNIADGEHTFDATFSWLRGNARPTTDAAAAVPIVGTMEEG